MFVADLDKNYIKTRVQFKQNLPFIVEERQYGAPTHKGDWTIVPRANKGKFSDVIMIHKLKRGKRLA